MSVDKYGIHALMKLSGQSDIGLDDAARLLANYGDNVALKLAGSPNELKQRLEDLANVRGSFITPTLAKHSTGAASKIMSSNALPDLVSDSIPKTNFLGNVFIRPHRTVSMRNNVRDIPAAIRGVSESFSGVPSIEVPNLDTKDLVLDHVQTSVPQIVPKNSYYVDTVLRPHNNTALGRWFREKMSQQPRTLEDGLNVAYGSRIHAQEIPLDTYWDNKEHFDELSETPLRSLFDTLYTPKKRVPQFKDSDFPDDFLTVVGDKK